MVLTQALGQAAIRNPGAPALIDLGKPLSFSDMRKKISQLSFLFQAEIGHGKRIAFLSQNTQAAALSFFAFSNIGCPVIFLDPAETPDSLAQAIKDLEVTHLCAGSDQVSRAADLIRSHGLSNLTVVEIEKKKGGEYDTSFSPPPDHPLQDSDPVLILRQSEHGQPVKYLFFTHKQVYSASTAVRRFYRFAANERVMTTMSWSHPFALVHGLLTPLFASATCAVDPQSPSNEEFLSYLAEQRINRFAGSPKFYYWLLSVCKAAKYLLPGTRSITVGGGHLPGSLRKTFGLLKIPVLQTHGRVEAIWTVAMEDLEKSREGASEMEGLPGFRYKVLNEEGDEIPGPGSRQGPFALSGEPVMTAFYHPDKTLAEKASKQTIRGTWLYTGEAARLEGENDEIKVKALGPLNDLIHSGQRFIGPEKIDAAARKLPGLADAAAFVRQDEKGRRFFALAVVASGKPPSEAQLLEALRQALPDQEAPQSIHFVDVIPRDAFDNLNRSALQRQFSR
jgi:acyl-CoA synthetase (AMP-forming)/AMP-acid ligase II